MKIENKITTITAEEGMLLRRKSDGLVVGESITLGYNYYEAGLGLPEKSWETPDDYEEFPKPEDYEAYDPIDHDRRLTAAARMLEEGKKEFKALGLTPEQMIKHQRFAPAWGEDIKEGDTVVKGEKFTYEGKLYAVLQDHTILPHYYPSVNTAALYVEVTPDYTEEGEEYGTLENPIPYEGNMILENGKYYTQDGVTYLCTRDSINPIYHPLSALVGHYVEEV
jgi:hypothetical protein